ncbi:glycyl-radical enzyme activating family protein [Candidatus Moduliflexus flocculans]|uniref:Glycyl-radical enzyme activating family protein n=1 Tax=Candidatus Moduliflexus flocculans TaxID=1499966 RepID=A0A0S6W0H0_9BACT|nr:glycyl-radical enzyme activating family protein [Candidatus Moduliflexus flocculans]
MLSGTIFNLQRYAVHDGPGIRITVFLKGCPLRCWWCHNPESQRREIETFAQTDRQIGREMTVDALLREIEKERVFFDESGGGVTFSGGEPLMQPEFLRAALQACQQREIHTALDTSGYAPADIFDATIELVDLCLFDLKLIDDQRHREYTGVSNAPILSNLRALSQRGKPLWLRLPIIPGITDTEKNLVDILALLPDITTIQQINLLPYHRIADGKYQRLLVANKMAGVESPSSERMDALKTHFETSGISVKIGG